MQKKHKVNPRKQPCTKAEAQKKADEAFYLAIAIMISTVAEDELYDDDGIRALWEKINYKADSIAKGYINLYDLVDALREEYGIDVAGVRI